MARGRTAGGLVLLSLAILSPPASAQLPSTSPRIAASCVDAALALRAAGKEAEALADIDLALSWDPSSSDALYLQALSDQRPGPSGPRELKAQRLAKALAADSFSRLSGEDARLDYCRALADMGRWAECAAEADKLGPDPAADALLLQAQAFFRLGQRASYFDALGRAVARYPADPRFVRFWAEHADTDRALPDDQAFFGRIAGLKASLQSADPELLADLAPFTADERRRAADLRAYLTQGGRGRRALLTCIRFGIEDQSLLADSFMAGVGTEAPLRAEEADSLLSLVSGRARTDFLAWLGSYSGQVAYDRNGDGMDDALASYAGGELTAWAADDDQDGLYEVSVAFADGAPATASFSGGPDGNLSLTWRSYPEVASLSFDAPADRMTYEFGASSLLLQPLSFAAPWKGAGLSLRTASTSPGFSLPSREGAALRADRATEEKTVEGRRLKIRTLLREGVPLSSETWTAGTLSEKTEYERGYPSLTRRDADGDGRFETLVRYAPDSDRPASLEMDADGDGLPEYREVYGQETRREWDFTADGLFDAAEERDADGTVRRWFSSGFRGELDVLLVLRDGKLESLRRGGKDLAVKTEPSGKVAWIGEMPFSLGASVPPSDGIFRKGGQSFHVYHASSGIVYAELIR